MISCKFCNSSIQYSLLFQPAQIAYKLLQEMHSYSQKQSGTILTTQRVDSVMVYCVN